LIDRTFYDRGRCTAPRSGPRDPIDLASRDPPRERSLCVDARDNGITRFYRTALHGSRRIQ
jgi:hypothetical protein